MKQLLKQQGSAIVVALFIVALVATMSIVMMQRFQVDTHRTSLFIQSQQAYLYAQGSVIWAKEQLKNNWQYKKSNELVDKMPLATTDKTNEAVITSDVEDAQGKFNINNLSEPSYQETFARLIHLISPETPGETVMLIALSVIDWISPPQKDFNMDEFYRKQHPAYLAPHRPMINISELRLVKGMTPDLYNKLSIYLIALPTVTPININSASNMVIMSLNPLMSQEMADNIIKARTLMPFPSINHFLKSEILKDLVIPENKITTTSQYFLLKTFVKMPEVNSLLYTLLQRSEKNKSVTVNVLWQNKGALT